MTPVQRVQAALNAQQPDRTAFSFWHHFPADQIAGEAAVRAHLDWLEMFGVDFLKVMNDNSCPHTQPIETIDGLVSLEHLRGDEDGFGRQIELISSLRRATHGQVLMTTTVFNARMVMPMLIQPPLVHKPPVMDGSSDHASGWIRDAWRKNPQAVEAALHTIGQNLARFARCCIAAGADGVFLSVRPDWIDAELHPGLYRRIVQPTDLHILSAASEGRFNVLHVCGTPGDLHPFNAFPVQALSWADRAAGPSIASVRDWLKPAICCGLDNLRRLPNGSPDDVKNEVADTIRQAAGRPILIAPGCTFDPAVVPPENLLAIRQSLETR